MKDGISLLSFSKDDIDNIKELIEDMYNYVDEIVLIDSSNKENKKRLFDFKKKNNYKKLKIYWVVPLGFVEPLRMYGINKCSFEWVLYLDTDEELSCLFKKDIRNIISNGKSDGFMVFRHEKLNGKFSHVTSQLRLFKKDRIIFRGAIHECAELNSFETLDKKYYILHKSDCNEEKFERYFKIESYISRISYKYLIDEFKNLKSVLLPIYLFFSIKIKLLKLENKELSFFDYILFYIFQKIATKIKLLKSKNKKLLYFDHSHSNQITRNLISYFTQRSFSTSWKSIKFNFLYYFNKLIYFNKFKVPDKLVQFNISQKIQSAGGVINFLNLNNDTTIKILNHKYANTDIQGVDLFIMLLKQKANLQNNKDYF